MTRAALKTAMLTRNSKTLTRKPRAKHRAAIIKGPDPSQLWQLASSRPETPQIA